MRHVKRTNVSPPDSLITPDGIGSNELARARTNFGSPTPKRFSFRAYKQEDVRDKLRELFKGKCAYCESYVSATAPTEVEHYRPKGGVEGDVGHPGYWWLAGCWENLLPSCIDCNRRRSHRIAVSGMTLTELTESARKAQCGKHKSFPISGGSTRARCEADNLDLEDPLLLNPCDKDPESHLEWSTAEELSVVASDDMQGATTVHLMGLNRQGLVENRTKLLLRMKSSAASVERLLDRAVKTDDPNMVAFLIEEAMAKVGEIRGDESDDYTALRVAYVTVLTNQLQGRYASLWSLMKTPGGAAIAKT